MDKKRKESLIASAPPEARAIYRALDAKGLLTEKTLGELAQMGESALEEIEAGQAQTGPSLRSQALESAARRHGTTPEALDEVSDLLGF